MVGGCREPLCCCNAILPRRMFWFPTCPAECASTARYTARPPGCRAQPWSRATCRLQSVLLNVMLYNDNLVLGSSCLSFLVQNSSRFKPERRMLLRHVGAPQQQQEAFTSGNHLRTCGCRQSKAKQFGTVWVDFYQVEFSFRIPGSFFWVPVYSFWMPPLLPVCVSPSFRPVYWEMSCWFRGVLMLMEEEPALDELQMFRRGWKMLIASDRWWGFWGRGDRTGLGWRRLHYSRLISRCVREHVGIAQVQPVF